MLTFFFHLLAWLSGNIFVLLCDGPIYYWDG